MKTRKHAIIVVAFAALAFSLPALAGQPAVERFVEWWNQGPDRPIPVEAVFDKGFIAERGAEELSGLAERLRRENGAIVGQTIESHRDGQVRFLVETDQGHFLKANIEVAAGDRIAGLRLRLEPAPPAEEDIGLNQTQMLERLDPWLRKLSAKDEFSGVVAIRHFQSIIYAQAFGYANMETRMRNSLDTPFNLGSMNKMFTSIAIAQLAQRKKLDFSDTVGKHLPDYPDADVRDNVTIHDLLTHTSGLGSYWNDAYEAAMNDLDSVSDFAALFAGQPLDFTPGDRFQYSNNGPVVLGLIIEALTGSDYFEYIRQNVYAPSRMFHCDHYDKFETDSGKAQGYMPGQDGKEWVSNLDTLGRIGSPAGGGYCSANGLLNFANALTAGRLVSPKMVELITTNKFDADEDVDYGYLFSDSRMNDVRYFGHGGGAPGINADLSIYPERGYAVVVLTNFDRAASPVADQIRTWIVYGR